MDQILAALVPAAGLAFVAVASWFSRRATREGRLTLRVERLGSLLAAIPNSAERETFSEHYLRAVRDLNEWLDLDARTLRTVNRWLNVVALVGAMGLALTIVSLRGTEDAAVNAWIGAGAGAIAGVAKLFVVARVQKKFARRKQISVDEKVAVAERSRFDALARGELPRS